MQRRSARLLLAATACAGAAVMAEIWAISEYANNRPDPPRPEEIRLPADLLASDPILGQRFRPNAGKFFASSHGEFAVNYQINEHGLRDAGTIFPGDRPPHVLVLGDAFVEGWGVMREATFIAEIQRQLRRRNGISQYTRLFNAGMSGYGAAQSYLQGQRLLQTIGADLIVLVYTSLMPVADHRFLQHATVDDHGIATGAGSYRFEPEGANARSDNWLMRSRLYRLAQTQLEARRARAALVPADPAHDLFAAARDAHPTFNALHQRSLEHVAALAALATEHDVEFMLVHVPLPHQVAADEWPAGRHGYAFGPGRYPAPEIALVEKFCGQHDLHCIMSAERLHEVAERNAAPVYFRHDYTLTAVGHRALANQLLDPIYEIMLKVPTTRY